MEALTAPRFHRLAPDEQARYLLRLREMGAEGHYQHLTQVMRIRGKWTYRQMEQHLQGCLKEAYAVYRTAEHQVTLGLEQMALEDV